MVNSICMFSERDISEHLKKKRVVRKNCFTLWKTWNITLAVLDIGMLCVFATQRCIDVSGMFLCPRVIHYYVVKSPPWPEKNLEFLCLGCVSRVSSPQYLCNLRACTRLVRMIH